MKKTITQIVCVGMFLVAALVFGQKMLVKGQSAIGKQADVHSASPDSVVAGGYSRNGPGASSEIQLADITGDITNPSVESDVAVAVASQDFADEGENSYIGNDFANDHIYGDGETIEGFGHGRNSAGYTSTGTGAGGRGHAGRKMARNPGSRNGGGYFPGGGGGGSGANPDRQSDSGQLPESTEPSRNGEREDEIPVLASREPAESEGTSEHKSSGNSPEKETETAGPGTNQGLHDEKEDGSNKVSSADDGESGSVDSNSPSGVEDSSPEFYDGAPDCVSCDSDAFPAKDADNLDYPPIDGSSGESSEAVASAVPEPASVLLTGLGSILLLWMQRRGN